jgi:hypothetical protein
VAKSPIEKVTMQALPMIGIALALLMLIAFVRSWCCSCPTSWSNEDDGMTRSLATRIGRTALKNPLIAASAEHLIDADGVRAALKAGAGAVVVKSTNEVQAAKDQLQRAEYMVLDEHWRPVPWGPTRLAAPPSPAAPACIRSASSPGWSRPRCSTVRRGRSIPMRSPA